MVINNGLLPTLHYRVSQWSGHWSQSDGGDCRPLIKPHVRNARGLLQLKFPLFNGQEEGNPPDPGEVLQGYLKQPPPSPHGSSQVDMANIMAHSSHSLLHGALERDTSPTPLLLLANSVNLSNNELHLQEEVNDAMVHLLSARAMIDMHHQWVISETEVSHCQNEIDTSEAIREIKAQ